MGDDTEDGLGTLMLPIRQHLMGARNRKSVLLMFEDLNDQRVSIVLPTQAAAALRDRLGEFLSGRQTAASDVTREQAFH
jgi:hypothetical protein